MQAQRWSHCRRRPPRRRRRAVMDRARPTKTKTGHTLCDPVVLAKNLAVARRAPRTAPCCRTRGNFAPLCVRVGSDSAGPAMAASPTYPPVLSTIPVPLRLRSRRLNRAAPAASIIIYPKCSKRWVLWQRVVEKRDFSAVFSLRFAGQFGPIKLIGRWTDKKLGVRWCFQPPCYDGIPRPPHHLP